MITQSPPHQPIQIGAQMSTLHHQMQTADQIKIAFERVAAMGYQTVQVSGLRIANTIDLPRVLQQCGLQCVATHVPMEMLCDPCKCIEYHQALNCQYTAIGCYAPQDDPYSHQSWLAFAQKLSAIADRLSEDGIDVGYHNHSHEWVRCDNGQIAMDLLVSHTSPNVWFEIDTYWVQQAGANPCDWLKKVAGRAPVLHYKDMSVDHERQQHMCEIGCGNLDWDQIINITKNIGTQYVLVERDFGKLDPFDSLQISLENLRQMGLGEPARSPLAT